MNLQDLDTKEWWVKSEREAFSWDGHASVWGPLNGPLKVWSAKTCHEGIVVSTIAEILAAHQWLIVQHNAGTRICDCVPEDKESYANQSSETL